MLLSSNIERSYLLSNFIRFDLPTVREMEKILEVERRLHYQVTSQSDRVKTPSDDWTTDICIRLSKLLSLNAYIVYNIYSYIAY